MYLPWLLYTNSLQDLKILVLVLNEKSRSVASLKEQYGKLLTSEVIDCQIRKNKGFKYITTELRQNPDFSTIHFLLNDFGDDQRVFRNNDRVTRRVAIATDGRLAITHGDNIDHQQNRGISEQQAPSGYDE
jgi:hypothetical protein